jgi:hypothetical protein
VDHGGAEFEHRVDGQIEGVARAVVREAEIDRHPRGGDRRPDREVGLLRQLLPVAREVSAHVERAPRCQEQRPARVAHHRLGGESGREGDELVLVWRGQSKREYMDGMS